MKIKNLTLKDNHSLRISKTLIILKIFSKTAIISMITI